MSLLHVLLLLLQVHVGCRRRRRGLLRLLELLLLLHHGARAALVTDAAAHGAALRLVLTARRDLRGGRGVTGSAGAVDAGGGC